jgi:hypothetical protein
MTERKLNIYYAHHQWKYGTKIEEYELDLIKAYFPNATIFNPSVSLNINGETEDEIMEFCLHQVGISDMVIFSSVDGLVGIGVFKEITHAKELNIPVYYIDRDELRYDFDMMANWLSNSDRTFGRVDLLDINR